MFYKIDIELLGLLSIFSDLEKRNRDVPDDRPRSCDAPAPKSPSFHAIVTYPESYVQPLIVRTLKRDENWSFDLIDSVKALPSPSAPLLQFTSYEDIDFDHTVQHPQSSLVSAYVIRKALIRKHFLSQTIATWLVKHPDSLLKGHFKDSVHFELDYAEFLDEALVDAWDLNESLSRNEQLEQGQLREWWILKPGMSDGGNGIRLFSTIEELRSIFEAWEIADESDDAGEGGEDSNEDADGVRTTSTEPTGRTGTATMSEYNMTNQLRHFIAQPYISRPLLLPSMGRRKFHIRAYVLAVGALRVCMYREMLALFAAKEYQLPTVSAEPDTQDLSGHLTNTCFQDTSSRASSVCRFWTLNDEDLPTTKKEEIFDQICDVTGEVFEAAAREQMVHFQAIPNAFEIFGVDFLVDEHCNVWLLELNAYPDFKQTGDELRDVVVGGLFEEVVAAAIKPFFDPAHQFRGSERMKIVRDVDLGRR